MGMTIGEVARRSGIASSAIRYYEEVGLLPKPSRTSGRRVFDEAMFDRLLLIEIAKTAGFSLKEIRQLFQDFPSGTPAAVRWRKLAAAKLAEVEALAVRVKTMKVLLEEARLRGSHPVRATVGCRSSEGSESKIDGRGDYASGADCPP